MLRQAQHEWSPRKGVWAIGVVFFLAIFVGFWNFAQAQGTATETIGMEIYIDPVFVVETSSAEGDEIHLDPLLLSAGPSPKTATVEIRTNRNRPYRVIQRVTQSPLSERGFPLPEDRIQFMVTDGAQGGRSQVTSPEPLGAGSSVLFASNANGDSDQFNILYSTSVAAIVPTGTYRAEVIVEGELR